MTDTTTTTAPEATTAPILYDWCAGLIKQSEYGDYYIRDIKWFEAEGNGAWVTAATEEEAEAAVIELGLGLEYDAEARAWYDEYQEEQVGYRTYYRLHVRRCEEAVDDNEDDAEEAGDEETLYAVINTHSSVSGYVAIVSVHADLRGACAVCTPGEDDGIGIVQVPAGTEAGGLLRAEEATAIDPDDLSAAYDDGAQ